MTTTDDAPMATCTDAVSEPTLALEAAASTRDPRPRRKRVPFPGTSAPAFDTVESAAAKLAVDPEALRARCRRAQRKEGDRVIAPLGGGIVAFKFGKTWRVRFPPV